MQVIPLLFKTGLHLSPEVKLYLRQLANNGNRVTGSTQGVEQIQGMAKKTNAPKPLRPAQQQKERPGREWRMNPRPQAERPEHKGTGKLQDKVAFITGGDSGIGRAVAILFAKEGAHVAISYLLEHKDAEETRKQVEQEGARVSAPAWRHWLSA